MFDFIECYPTGRCCERRELLLPVRRDDCGEEVVAVVRRSPGEAVLPVAPDIVLLEECREEEEV